MFSIAAISATQYLRSNTLPASSAPSLYSIFSPSGKIRIIGEVIRERPGSSLYVIFLPRVVIGRRAHCGLDINPILFYLHPASHRVPIIYQIPYPLHLIPSRFLGWFCGSGWFYGCFALRLPFRLLRILPLPSVASSCSAALHSRR